MAVSDYVIEQNDLGKTIRVSCPIVQDTKYQSFDAALADTVSITIRQASGTPGFVYSNVKLEKGSVATDWCPNPSEILTKGDVIINVISQADYDKLTDKTGVYYIEG